MSWLQRLCETYQQCKGKPEFSDGDVPLMPVSHTSQQAQIIVVIDGEGNFLRAEVVEGKKQFIIPATEASAGRTSGAASHPLADKIHYCAKDYEGEKKNCFDLYSQILESWCASPHCHPKARAVLNYVGKGRLVHDLVNAGVMQGDNGGRLLTEPPEENASSLFKLLTPKKSGGKTIRDQGDALVCWRVEIPGDTHPNAWQDESLQESWIDFDAEQSETRQFCMVTGETSSPAGQHPRNIRRPGDGAKLISSNDQAGFTFRGRFLEADQSSSVGYRATHMAHNALRWLITRQGYRNGEQVVVAWAVNGEEVPHLMQDDWYSKELLREMNEPDREQPDDKGTDQAKDAGQSYSRALRKKLRGYKKQLAPTDSIIILGLDAATPGRLSVTYYKEMHAHGTDGGYLERLEQWQEDCAWKLLRSIPDKDDAKSKTKTVRPVCAPLPREVCAAAYGQRADDKLKRITEERLLPCIADRAPLPRDLVDSAVRRACGSFSPDKKAERETVLGVACALYKGWSARLPEQEKRRKYSMALQKEYTSRDYLYGRLLAVAEYAERKYIEAAGEKRQSDAERLIQRFADLPQPTWRLIATRLENIFLPWLRSGNPLQQSDHKRCRKALQEISMLFVTEEYNKKDKLSGEFLLGYYCQLADFYTPKKPEPTNEGEE